MAGPFTLTMHLWLLPGLISVIIMQEVVVDMVELFIFPVHGVVGPSYFSDSKQCRKKWSCMVEPFIMMVTASITVTNSTFVKNRANEGRRGALYSARHYTHYCP